MSLVTHKGIEFDYINPTKEMIDVDDIIHSLININRFIGHSSRAYSVGEHTFYCFMMAQMLGYTTREKLLVLIHDFTEAYVGDCPTPLKKLLPEFALIEEKVENAICERFGIEPPTEEEFKKIKAIDMTMLVVEMRDLTEHSWENFVNEQVIAGMLSQDYLNLDPDKYMNKTVLKKSLTEIFDITFAKYKHEEMLVQKGN